MNKWSQDIKRESYLMKCPKCGVEFRCTGACLGRDIGKSTRHRRFDRHSCRCGDCDISSISFREECGKI